MTWAEKFDSWRVFPRIFALLFAYLMWVTHVWYTHLAVPTTEQSAYASAMVLTAAGFFKFYVESGVKRNGPT